MKPDISPVILWGSSFGGTISLGVAARVSGLVRALVLEDAWIDLQTSKDESWGVLWTMNWHYKR